MYRNPRVKQITARAVFENDDFDYGYGLTPFLNHKPARKDKGKLECVYATCLVDNEPIFVVVEKAELDAIRQISQTIGSQYSPYNNGTDVHNWMEIKAGIKSLSKLIPTSNNIEMAKAVEYDSKFEGGARVLVELPSSPNEIVEPKLVDGNIVSKTLNTAFDFVEEEIEEEIPAINLDISELPSETNEFVNEEEIYEEPYSTEIKPVSPTNDDDDITFDFPDNDDDDDNVIPSNLF